MVLLPTGVNPIAVDKYINIYTYKHMCIGVGAEDNIQIDLKETKCVYELEIYVTYMYI